MNKIEARVRKIIEEYSTAEPEDICENMGIITLSQPLPACVNGFTVRMNDIPFIVINSSLDYHQKRVTMAHELGHVVLHKGTNSIELSCNTSFCISKYEKEADTFAAYLLMYAELSAFEGYESLTVEELSRLAHIPVGMAQYIRDELS